MEPGREGTEGGGEAHAEHQAYRGVVGVRAEARGRKEAVVRWNSGRTRLNTRLVDTVLSFSAISEEDSVDV